MVRTRRSLRFLSYWAVISSAYWFWYNGVEGLLNSRDGQQEWKEKRRNLFGSWQLWLEVEGLDEIFPEKEAKR